MTRLLYVLLVFMSFGVLFSTKSQAQVTYKIALDTNLLLIGDQTQMTLEATGPANLDVLLPAFSDTVIDKLEIIDIANIDTVFLDEEIKISQSYTVTCFDSGWYHIPPQAFIIRTDNGEFIDTAYSKSLYFGVVTMPLDTLNVNAITDIKGVIKAPLTFKEVLPYAGLSMLIALLFLAYFYYKRYTRKEPEVRKKQKPSEPAHIIAFRDLDALQNSKLWQEGKVKMYYSQLTDIIRTYIDNRYGIMAMEATTDEIIDAFKNEQVLSKKLKEELFDVLVRADFVKFAKASTTPQENEASLKFAYSFVLSTKIEPVEKEEEEAAENKEEPTLEKQN